MKVLLINSVCGIRSTGRIVKDIAFDYMSKGYECVIAYGREKPSEDCRDISYRIGNDFDTYLSVLKVRLFDNDGFNNKSSTKKFLKWAEKYNPDILWLHNLHGYYINIELLFEWIKSRPDMQVRWTLHDCWAFTGHCSHFSYINCQKWMKQCCDCRLKRDYPNSIFADNSFNNFKNKKQLFTQVKNLKIITPSKWLSDLVKSSFLAEYPVEVIHNKIDYSVFKPTQSDFRQRYALEDKKLILGVASAWSVKKGLQDFIKLSQLLDDSFKVILVGVTKKDIKNIPPKILCIQRTNSTKELAEIYTAADVFLNLTYEDTYPTVNLESQACGTKCITYKTGGSVESVDDEYIVEQGDLDSVVSKINSILGGSL